MNINILKKKDLKRYDWLHAFILESWLARYKPRCLITDPAPVLVENSREMFPPLIYYSGQEKRQKRGREGKSIWVVSRIDLRLNSFFHHHIKPGHSFLIIVSLELYLCGKMLHCFMLALGPRTPRGRRAPSFGLLRVNCSDRARRAPSLALCSLEAKKLI